MGSGELNKFQGGSRFVNSEPNLVANDKWPEAKLLDQGLKGTLHWHMTHGAGDSLPQQVANAALQEEIRMSKLQTLQGDAQWKRET